LLNSASTLNNPQRLLLQKLNFSPPFYPYPIRSYKIRKIVCAAELGSHNWGRLLKLVKALDDKRKLFPVRYLEKNACHKKNTLLLYKVYHRRDKMITVFDVATPEELKGMFGDDFSDEDMEFFRSSNINTNCARLAILYANRGDTRKSEEYLALIEDDQYRQETDMFIHERVD
jgi:hypothetical protein